MEDKDCGCENKKIENWPEEEDKTGDFFIYKLGDDYMHVENYEKCVQETVDEDGNINTCLPKTFPDKKCSFRVYDKLKNTNLIECEEFNYLDKIRNLTPLINPKQERNTELFGLSNIVTKISMIKDNEEVVETPPPEIEEENDLEKIKFILNKLDNLK